MKTTRILMMAALALIMAACSDDIIDPEPKLGGAGISFTTTISINPDSTVTRALALKTDGNGKKYFQATWAEGEEVALIYSDGSEKYLDIATVTAVEDGVATISGEITPKKSGYVPTDGVAVKIVYPYSAVNLTTTTTGEFCEIKNDLFLKQDGTYETISSQYDLRIGNGFIKLTSSNTATAAGSADGTGAVKMENQIAIFKITTKNKGGAGSNFSVTRFSIRDSECNLIAKVSKRNNNNTTYVALPIKGMTAGTKLMFDGGTSTNPSNGFCEATLNKDLTASYYETTMAMERMGGIYGSGKVQYLTAESGEITLNNNDMLVGTGGPDTHVTIAADASVTLQNVDITQIPNDLDHQWAGITCVGNATINLEGTNKVKAGYEDFAGIQAAHNTGSGDEYTLTINGPGTLEAEGGRGGAGIGTNWGSGQRCGNITINGGNITAQSGNIGGAGIGSGLHSTCGNITILGGNITAKANNGGAGIGCGRMGTCGKISISGGTINAEAWSGAGIGSGESDNDNSLCGDITITGGNVTAESKKGAGIGTGYSSSKTDKSTSCGKISITGGTVTAKGGHFSAGIGTGQVENVYSSCGDILISGGTVTAIAGTEALTAIGISTGGTCTDITIENTITSVAMTNANATNTNTVIKNFICTSATYGWVNFSDCGCGSGISINWENISERFNSSYDSATKTWTLTQK